MFWTSARSARAWVSILAIAAVSACASLERNAAALCAAGGVAIDVAFEGAGMHRCLQTADGAFVLSVEPEAQPINPSPWFAFRMSAREPGPVRVTLRYEGADHRYRPQINSNEAGWRPLADEAIAVDHAAGAATLSLDLQRGDTFIAAQPLQNGAETLAWARTVLLRAGFQEIEYGRSLDGRALVAFAGGGQTGDGMIVAMTRQHPPEITGARAFQAFVEVLAADNEAARAFRAGHRILLAPMPNPDGVARGHWRLNAGGVDLNRDWGPFTQPETGALADLIERERVNRRVVAFIDFHSTQRSVVYAPPLDAASPTIGFLSYLEQQFQARLERPPAWSYNHNANAGVTKAWALERLGAPGITLELADTASEEDIGAIGEATATATIEYFSGGGAEAADTVYPSARRFRFSAWAGPALPVWIYRPPTAGDDAPVLFVMHGVRRDADRYLREWAPLADRHAAVLVVPEFSAESFPRAANYNLGAVLDDNHEPRPQALWSYAAIENIFDQVAARERLNASGYRLYGHSAGAQFVHRFVMLGAGPRLERAVVANAGWYTLPSTDVTWPYGLRGGPAAPSARGMFAAPLHLLLGDQDTDPQHPSLSREPGAMAQGVHRFARGQTFYARARESALSGDAEFRWTCSIAPGLAHDNALAARYAAEILFGAAPPADRTCHTLAAITD